MLLYQLIIVALKHFTYLHCFKVFRAKERIDEELQSKAPSQGSSENEAPPSNRKTQSSRDS